MCHFLLSVLWWCLLSIKNDNRLRRLTYPDSCFFSACSVLSFNASRLSVPLVQRPLLPVVSVLFPPQYKTHSRLVFALVRHHTHSAVFVKRTVLTRPSVPRRICWWVDIESVSLYWCLFANRCLHLCSRHHYRCPILTTQIRVWPQLRTQRVCVFFFLNVYKMGLIFS